MGQSPPGNTYNDQQDGLPFFQGKKEFADLNPTVRQWCTAPSKIADPGDILLCIRAPVGPTNIADQRCAIGRGLAAIKPSGEIPSKWLLYSLRFKEASIAEQGTGSTFTAISQRHLDNIEVEVPPLPEQRRIIAQVDGLEERLKTAKERLAKVPAILKQFRQSVLAAACSGRLTADWRTAQTNLEPAGKLVERITKKRQSLYRTECQQATLEGRRVHRPPANLEPGSVDRMTLSDTPDEWQWVRLPFLGELNRGKSRHRPRDAAHLYGGPYPFIQTGDVAQSNGEITTHKQTYSEAGLAQSRLWPAGTVVISIAANIAASAILTYPACFPDSVVGLICDDNLCNPKFSDYCVRMARNNLAELAPATAQKNINIAILSDVFIPLPPFAEQHEIVRRVEALFRLADAIEARVAMATARAEKLTQAVLAKAFRGELVPTEAELARREGRDFEPAAMLLERLKAERGRAGELSHSKGPRKERRPKAAT